MGSNATSNIEAVRPVWQFRYAARPCAIDEVAPITERRVEDIVAAIFRKKSICSFVVDFDGSSA